MLGGVFSFFGGLFSLIGAALKALIGLAIYRAGEAAQQKSDIEATGKIVEKERDAVDSADDAQTAAGKDEF